MWVALSIEPVNWLCILAHLLLSQTIGTLRSCEMKLSGSERYASPLCFRIVMNVSRFDGFAMSWTRKSRLDRKWVQLGDCDMKLRWRRLSGMKL